MKKITLCILCVCATIIAGCGIENDKPVKSTEESNTIESESGNQDGNTEKPGGEILNSESEPEDNKKPLTDYSLVTGEHEGYNAILDVNGYQYFFHMAMQPENIELQSPKEREEERYGEKVKVFSIVVSDGKSEEELGYIYGFLFTPTSDCYVEPEFQKGNKICGKIASCEERRVSLYKAEEVDRDTYIEFTNVSEKETEYIISQDTQYIILDGNFASTSVTWERFQEYLTREKNIFYYFIENEGVITQIWEPYIP